MLHCTYKQSLVHKESLHHHTVSAELHPRLQCLWLAVHQSTVQMCWSFRKCKKLRALCRGLQTRGSALLASRLPMLAKIYVHECCTCSQKSRQCAETWCQVTSLRVCAWPWRSLAVTAGMAPSFKLCCCHVLCMGR